MGHCFDIIWSAVPHGSSMWREASSETADFKKESVCRHLLPRGDSWCIFPQKGVEVGSVHETFTQPKNISSIYCIPNVKANLAQTPANEH